VIQHVAREDHHVTDIEQPQNVGADHHLLGEELDLAAHRGNITDPTCSLLYGLMIPARCLWLVAQMEIDLAERGQEPVVMLLVWLLPFADDVGEGPLSEVTGFLALTSQQGHRSSVDAWKRVGTTLIGEFVIFS